MSRYHMNKKEGEIVEQEQLIGILKHCKYATIAMCRNNEPYVVTLSHGYDPVKNALYFHSARKGLKIDFIAENPNVCATVIEDGGYRMGECEHNYSSVVLWGKMSVVESLEEKKHAMDILIGQLEEKPDEVKTRIFKNDSVYAGVGLLRLDIEEMTGKKGS